MYSSSEFENQVKPSIILKITNIQSKICAKFTVCKLAANKLGSNFHLGGNTSYYKLVQYMLLAYVVYALFSIIVLLTTSS